MRSAGLYSLTLGIILSLSACLTWEGAQLPASEWSPLLRLAPISYNLPLDYAPWTIRYCDETGVPIWLASRMFSVESSGDPLGPWNKRAVSYMGAQGLAQLMPFNLSSFASRYNDGKVIDPFDPETAIRVGIRYLADLYGETGSWSVALKSYNGGISHYYEPWKWGPWREESVQYAIKILGKEKLGL